MSGYLHAVAGAGRTVARRSAASEYLLWLEFGNRLDPTRFRSGIGDLVSSVQRVQRQAFLCFELLGAAGVRSSGTALRLLNGDGTIDPVNFGNRSRKRLLGQSRRTDDVESLSAT